MKITNEVPNPAQYRTEFIATPPRQRFMISNLHICSEMVGQDQTTQKAGARLGGAERAV